MKRRSLEDAERCWRRALSLDSNHQLALLDLGRLALSRRRLDEAVGLLERAAALAPGSLDPDLQSEPGLSSER